MAIRDGLKIINIGQSAAKFRIGKCSTTSVDECKHVESQAIGDSKR